MFGTPVILVSLAVNVSAAYILIPRHGINGGALALVIGQYVMFAGYMVLSRWRFGTPIMTFLVPSRDDVKIIIHVVRGIVRRPFSR